MDQKSLSNQPKSKESQVPRMPLWSLGSAVPVTVYLLYRAFPTAGGAPVLSMCPGLPSRSLGHGRNIFDSGWFQRVLGPPLHLTYPGLRCYPGLIPHSSCTFRWSPAAPPTSGNGLKISRGGTCDHGFTLKKKTCWIDSDTMFILRRHMKHGDCGTGFSFGIFLGLANSWKSVAGSNEMIKSTVRAFWNRNKDGISKKATLRRPGRQRQKTSAFVIVGCARIDDFLPLDHWDFPASLPPILACITMKVTASGPGKTPRFS